MCRQPFRHHVNQMSTSRTVGVGRGERQTLLTNARGRRTVSTLQTNRPHRGRGWMMTRMGQQYGTVRQRALPGVSYVPAELGRGAHQTGDELLAALSVPSAGQLFDLDAGRWPGMPVLPVHPPFVMTTYRTPGRAVRTPDAATETGVTTELIVSSAHTGTHIDALCHVTEGSRWFGGGLDAEHLGDFGPTLAEASSIPPFLCRGVLLDVAALRGVEALPAGERITAEDLRAAADRQGV